MRNAMAPPRQDAGPRCRGAGASLWRHLPVVHRDASTVAAPFPPLGGDLFPVEGVAAGCDRPLLETSRVARCALTHTSLLRNGIAWAASRGSRSDGDDRHGQRARTTFA